jgi:hypothetical protein
VQSTTDLRFSPYVVSFLADDILLLRYVESAGQLNKSLVVVKMRNSAHSTTLRRYEITAHGLVVRESFQDTHGIGLGTTEVWEGARHNRHPGLTDQEIVVLQALVELGEARVDVLARRIGLPEGPILDAALNRLVSLNYAILLADADGIIYRPVAQVWG